MNAFFRRSGRKGLRRCFAINAEGKKKHRHTVSKAGVNCDWDWQLNRDAVWRFRGRRVLLEGPLPLWSFGVRQVSLPALCTFVARWLRSSDWVWQGVRAGSKWRAFSMISCQLSLITLSLYLSLVCSHNLFLSLLIELSLHPRFFSPTHPTLPLSFPTSSVFTLDMRRGEGFWWGPIKAYKPRLYRPHVFYNASLEAFLKFSGLHSWWLRRFIAFSLRRKWMLHLCHFNRRLIMSGRIAWSSLYQNKTLWCLVWKGR